MQWNLIFCDDPMNLIIAFNLTDNQYNLNKLKMSTLIQNSEKQLYHNFENKLTYTYVNQT